MTAWTPDLWVPRRKPPLGAVVNPAHPLSRGLIRLWPFSEAGGTSVRDVLNHETLVSTGTGPTWGVASDGLVWNINSSTAPFQAAVLPDLANLTSGPFSMAVRWQSTMIVNAQRGIGLWSVGNTALAALFALDNATGKMRFLVRNAASGGTAAFSATALSITTAYWFVGTYDGSVVKIYMNGLVGTAGSCTGTPQTSVNIFAGSDASGANTGPVSLGGAAIWNRCLSAAEVGWHFQDPWAVMRPAPQNAATLFYLLGAATVANARTGSGRTPIGLAGIPLGKLGARAGGYATIAVPVVGTARRAALGHATITTGTPATLTTRRAALAHTIASLAITEPATAKKSASTHGTTALAVPLTQAGGKAGAGSGAAILSLALAATLTGKKAAHTAAAASLAVPLITLTRKGLTGAATIALGLTTPLTTRKGGQAHTVITTGTPGYSTAAKAGLTAAVALLGTRTADTASRAAGGAVRACLGVLTKATGFRTGGTTYTLHGPTTALLVKTGRKLAQLVGSGQTTTGG